VLGKRIKLYINKIYALPKVEPKVPCIAKGSSPDIEGGQEVILLGLESADKAVVKARIIAVISTDKMYLKGRRKSDDVYIAAPLGKVYYKPDISYFLSFIPEYADYHLYCHFEKSCGAVVYRKRSGNIEYLLIKNKKGNNWGFPKGHIEFGENEIQTAVREVREEIGINIVPVDGFRVISEYHPHGDVSKRVILFLAEMTEEEIHIQDSEIDRYIWADYALAQNTFKFNNDRYVLSKARDWIKKKSI